MKIKLLINKTYGVDFYGN